MEIKEKNGTRTDAQLNVSDALSKNLDEVKVQVAEYGEILEKIVAELEGVPTGAAMDAFRTQVVRKQLYLENLLDVTSGEIDLLKRDVRTIARDLKEVKDALQRVQYREAVPIGNEQMTPATDLAPDAPMADEDREMLDVMRQHPLSSIPPRQLSENEAMSFLKAIDEIVTKRRISDFPAPFASEK